MLDILNTVLKKYIQFNNIESIAFGGSTTSKTNDNTSDIDIYIFSKNDIPIYIREKIIKPISSKYEIGCEYFGAGDEYFVDELNKQLDVMYWNTDWFENVVNNTWIKCYPQNGYTTCFLYTLKNFKIFYDKNNWLRNLQETINTPYPQQLKHNIIKRNLMLMKDKPFASYYEQIKKAILRNDVNSVNQREAAFIASYFDIIFALNEQLHPGEKRLIQFAKNNCKILPNNFELNLMKLFQQQPLEILETLDIIIAELKSVLKNI